MENDIKRYMEEQIPTLTGNIYPVFTTDLSRLTIAYAFTPVSGGHLKQSVLEIRIVGADFDECKQTEQQISAILDMEDDAPYVLSGATRFRSGLSGGGLLFQEEIQRYEVTAIYTIDWR